MTKFGKKLALVRKIVEPQGIRPIALVRLKRFPCMGGRSDRYAQQTFDFYDRLHDLKEISEIELAVIEAMKSLGYEYLTIWSIPPPGCPLKGILLNTRPEQYVDRYVEKNYVLRDPVVNFLRQTSRPYSWGDVRQKLPLTKVESAIIDEAREFDVRDGMTIPILTARGAWSVVSPCGRDPDLSPRARSAAEMIGIIGHQALRRARMERFVEQTNYSPLTAREREVLQYVAFGKTDSEIAIILGVSPTTVLAHAENAKRKLGAAKRTLAIILALQKGEISL